MAVATGRYVRPGRFSTGQRSGVFIMVAGLVVAVLAAVLVFVVAQRSRTTTTLAPAVAPQVDLVVLTQDIPAGSGIPSTALAVKSYPQGFAPSGALTAADQVTGKYATSSLSSGQFVLPGQVTATAPLTKLTESIPVGKVALWMPIPALLGQSGALQAGDKVDILLSTSIPGATPQAPSGDGTPVADQSAGTGAGSSASLTTQTTLQNVEVLQVGEVEAVTTPTLVSQATQGVKATQAALEAVGATTPTAKAGPQQMVLFILDPQDAIVAKYIKDSGGMIDFVMRAPTSQDASTTVAVDARSLSERFNFRPR